MLTLKRGDCSVKVMQSPEEALDLINRLKSRKETLKLALDFETTALRPDDSDDAAVRITSLSTGANISYVIDHLLCGPFDSYADSLMEAGPVFVFNANFEGRWFANSVSSLNLLHRKILDVAHMRRSVLGGGPLSLKDMCKRDLKLDIEKEEQLSDWSAPKLTNAQYWYAGFDSIVTWRLASKWSQEMTDRHWNGFHVINDAWRAVNECEDTGLLIDEPYHRSLISMWGKRRDASEAALRRYIPVTAIQNIRSKKQISDFLKTILSDDAVAAWPKTDKTEQLQTDRNTLRSMSYISPYPLSRALACLMVFNRADKYLGTYGETLLTKALLSPDSRVRSRLNMAAAITGRFSSSGPNQQNFPHSSTFRRSFYAALGTKFCLADYSGVEIRVLAELSKDEILLHDAIYDDVHTQSAIAIYHIDDIEGFKRRIKAKEPKAREMRARAKAFTFQLLYGAGAAALSIALRCSLDDANLAIQAWARRYSRAYAYRQYMYEIMKGTGFLPCASGRTIFVHRADRSMPVAANYPIQGSAADVIYRAMYHVQIELEQAELAAYLMASVHDELLLLSDEECAIPALAALQRGMEKAWLDIFPDSNTDNLMDAIIGDRWSDKA